VNRARKEILIVCGVLTAVLAGCERSEPVPQETVQEQHAAPAPAAAATLTPPEALPRSIAEVTLGMTLADAEGKLGHLQCHENKVGYRVCNREADLSAEVRHLELYVSHDQVISVSYESTAPPNVWDFLDRLMGRYGHPALSGMRERDTAGRLHEVYGWKDETSLYSVRLIWKDTPAGDRDLVGTAIALWDRKGYQQWEDEMKQRPAPTPPDQQGPAEI